MTPRARWFLRAVQDEDHRWTCRRGRLIYDTHGGLEAAVAHLAVLARDLGPTDIYAHHLDGTVERVTQLGEG